MQEGIGKLTLCILLLKIKPSASSAVELVLFFASQVLIEIFFSIIENKCLEMWSLGTGMNVIFPLVLCCRDRKVRRVSSGGRSTLMPEEME
jgi:hypothetical protein